MEKTKIEVLRGIIEHPDKSNTRTITTFGKQSEVVNKLVAMVWEKDEITYYAKLASNKVIEVLKDEVVFLPRTSTIKVEEVINGKRIIVSYSEAIDVKYLINQDIVNNWLKQLITN